MPSRKQDEGFMLAAAIVLVFLVLLALSVAAPRIAIDLKRQREVEAQHRANQYVRALRIYYKKFNRYPTTVDQLEKSNNQRFLRQKYLDPLTGKDNWRIIHVGENKTKVKGFFGEDLPGVGGTGLGTTPGATSTTGSSNNPTGTNSGLGVSSSGGLGPSGSNSGSSGNGSSSGANSGSGSGVQSTDAANFNGSGGGPIMGIGSSKTGESILTINEQTTYDTWEFLYDPRIEQLYAKGNLLGGVNSGSGTSTGLPTYDPTKPNGGGINNPLSPTTGSPPAPGSPITPGTTPTPGTSSPQ